MKYYLQNETQPEAQLIVQRKSDTSFQSNLENLLGSIFF